MPSLVERLRAAGCVFAEEEAALLSAAASGDTLEALVGRRTAGEPLEYVLGQVEFCGQAFALEPGVFIPRQRSELLVRTAVDAGGGLVVDLCCGCGALGLSVADQLGAELYAVDLDPRAVALAARNGASNALVGDLYEPLPRSLAGRVDLLLCNAPYVPTDSVADMPRESRDHEPRTTVDGGSDGMDVQRRIFANARTWLAPGGTLVTETSRAQAPALRALATSAGLTAHIVTDEELGATVLVA